MAAPVANVSEGAVTWSRARGTGMVGHGDGAPSEFPHWYTRACRWASRALNPSKAFVARENSRASREM
ncbi:MAG: hypothetical protein QXW06_02155, partial [Thermoplasmata archaeon]